MVTSRPMFWRNVSLPSSLSNLSLLPASAGLLLGLCIELSVGGNGLPSRVVTVFLTILGAICLTIDTGMNL